MKEHDDRNTKENLCPDCGKIYKYLTDLRKHCCMSKHSYPKFQIQIYNFVTVVKLLVECEVGYVGGVCSLSLGTEPFFSSSSFLHITLILYSLDIMFKAQG